MRRGRVLIKEKPGIEGVEAVVAGADISDLCAGRGASHIIIRQPEDSLKRLSDRSYHSPNKVRPGGFPSGLPLKDFVILGSTQREEELREIRFLDKTQWEEVTTFDLFVL